MALFIIKKVLNKITLRSSKEKNNVRVIVPTVENLSGSIVGLVCLVQISNAIDSYVESRQAIYYGCIPTESWFGKECYQYQLLQKNVKE